MFRTLLFDGVFSVRLPGCSSTSCRWKRRRAETHFAADISFYTDQHGGRCFPFATEKFFKGRNCFCSDLYILFSVKMRAEKQASDPVCNNLIKTAQLKKEPCGVFL